jgi:hypothetical protein
MPYGPPTELLAALNEQNLPERARILRAPAAPHVPGGPSRSIPVQVAVDRPCRVSIPGAVAEAVLADQARDPSTRMVVFARGEDVRRGDELRVRFALPDGTFDPEDDTEFAFRVVGVAAPRSRQAMHKTYVVPA